MCDVHKYDNLCACVQMVQNVHVNQKIRKLLAIGKRFAVVLLPYVDNKYKNLGQSCYIL